MKDLMMCLEIGIKYGDDCCAEHDVIYFTGPPRPPKTEEHKADTLALEALNAGVDSEGWYFFT